MEGVDKSQVKQVQEDNPMSGLRGSILMGSQVGRGARWGRDHLQCRRMHRSQRLER